MTIPETTIPFALPMSCRTALNSALFELREYTENIRIDFDHAYPEGTSDVDKVGLARELWVEDLEQLVDLLDTLEFKAAEDPEPDELNTSWRSREV